MATYLSLILFLFFSGCHTKNWNMETNIFFRVFSEKLLQQQERSGWGHDTSVCHLCGITDLTFPWCYRCRTAGRVEVGAARSVYTGNQVVASCCTGVACCGAGQWPSVGQSSPLPQFHIINVWVLHDSLLSLVWDMHGTCRIISSSSQEIVECSHFLTVVCTQTATKLEW